MTHHPSVLATTSTLTPATITPLQLRDVTSCTAAQLVTSLSFFITSLQLRACQVCSPIHLNPSPWDSLIAGGLLPVGIEAQTWPLTPSQLERCHQLCCSATGDISPVGRVLKVRFGVRFPLATTHLRWGNPGVRGWGVLGCRPDMLSVGGVL